MASICRFNWCPTYCQRLQLWTHCYYLINRTHSDTWIIIVFWLCDIWTCCHRYLYRVNLGRIYNHLYIYYGERHPTKKALNKAHHLLFLMRKLILNLNLPATQMCEHVMAMLSFIYACAIWLQFTEGLICNTKVHSFFLCSCLDFFFF